MTRRIIKSKPDKLLLIRSLGLQCLRVARLVGDRKPLLRALYDLRWEVNQVIYNIGADE